MRKNMDVKFSIIIPVYNVENYLEECLESVICQTFRSFEALCVYDQSSDESINILNRYRAKDSRIKILLNEEKKGLSHARNEGVRQAKGEYLLFLDSDDMLSTNALEVIFHSFQDQIDVVYYGAMTMEEKEGLRIYEDYCNHGNLNNIYNGREMISNMVAIGDMRMAAWLQCWRRSSYIKYNLCFYTGILHEDNLFSYLGGMNAEAAVCINDRLYVYRKRKESLINQEQTMWCIRSWITIYKEILKYWNFHSNPEIDYATIQFLREVEPNIYYCYRDIRKLKNDVITLDSIDGYMLETIVSRYNWIETSPISPDVLEAIKSENGVYIFGAKKIGQNQRHYLIENGVKVEGIIVSNKGENIEYIEETPVLESNDDRIDKNKLVIIGARRVLWTEIIVDLQNKGFNRICTFNGIGYKKEEK